MSPRLNEQLEQVQKDLTRKITEAEHIGECLMTLGMRLREEPWKWTIDWLEDAFPGSNGTCLIESDMVQALDRHRLEWLLEDLRILKRREAELKRLAAA